jgi:cell division protein ZipA
MKELFIIIGTLLILLVLFDGIRRKRNERLGKIKVSRTLKKTIKQSSDYDDLDEEAPSYTSELPNGGARVVGQRGSSAPIPSIEKRAQAKSYLEKRQPKQQEPTPQENISSRGYREPKQTSLNLGQAVPMLMESVEDKNRSLALEDRIEPSFSAQPEGDLYDEQDDRDYQDDRSYSEPDRYETDDEDYDENNDSEAYSAAYPEEDREEYRENYDRRAELDDDEDDEYVDEVDSLNTEDHDGYEDEGYDETDYDEDEYDEEEQPNDNYGATAGNSSQQHFAEKQPAEPEEVLIINVMAHKGEMFKGSELLDIVLKCGMRYGSMDIFHRHSDVKGEGALLFSMANMVKPGTFDLDAMDEFETPGVSLFMTLPINADSMQSFDLMADTARAIAETLNGELKDEQRSVMTRQTLEHCRQRIRDFERMRLFRRPPPR